MIDPGVVSRARVHPNGDGDLFARPSAGTTRAVAACEPSHDIGIVCFDAVFAVVVFLVEVEMKITFFQ